MGGQCRLSMLGGFRADVDGRPVPADAWRHRRGADLIKMLALLPSGSLSIDAVEFEAAALDAGRRGDREAAAGASELYTGDLLPEDRYEPWAEAPRERLRRRFVEVLKLARRWQRVLEVDPLDEQAHRELMRASLLAGDRQAAMRQFETLRTLLQEELGVGPDPESVALYQEVLAAEGPQPTTPVERVGARLAAGLVAMNRMELEEAEREARAARTLAVEAGLGKELGQASGLLGMVAHMRGEWRDLFREEFQQTLTEAPHLAGHVFDAHLCLGEFSLAGPDGPEEVQGFARELLETAESRDSLHGIALATLMLGESELMAGRLETAERDLSRSAELHGKAGATAGRSLALERLGEAALARGRRSRAARLLRDALALARESELASHIVVRVHGARVQLADASAATAEVRRAAKDLADEDVCEPCSIGFLIAATIALARAGAQEEAGDFLGRAERVAAMWRGDRGWPACGRPGPSCGWRRLSPLRPPRSSARPRICSPGAAIPSRSPGVGPKPRESTEAWAPGTLRERLGRSVPAGGAPTPGKGDSGAPGVPRRQELRWVMDRVRLAGGGPGREGRTTMKEMMAMTSIGQPFTSANWTVKPGNEDEFARRWTAFTQWAQREAGGAQGFVLIRHVEDPRQFVSFGMWENKESVDRWRSTPEFMQHLGSCREVCDEFRPADSVVAAAVAP